MGSSYLPRPWLSHEPWTRTLGTLSAVPCRRCEVKVIDLGSSCYVSDQLSSYVQSRSYRAPEVILGLPYDQRVDIWSLGAILAELLSGAVLFQVCVPPPRVFLWPPGGGGVNLQCMDVTAHSAAWVADGALCNPDRVRTHCGGATERAAQEPHAAGPPVPPQVALEAGPSTHVACAAA